MNNKVEELVGWVAENLEAYNGEGYIELAKRILSHPDLALIDREKEKPRIHYGSFLSIKGGDERIVGWELHERRMKEEGFTYSIIPLAEALKENSENAEKRHCSECNWEGLENETGFGHDDFYCPICLRETLDICEVKQ